MIIYSDTKKAFKEDVFLNRIETKIYDAYKQKIGKTTKSEFTSWVNSMQYMNNVLMHSMIPDDVMVAIEYQVPNTSKRVDFIITGLNPSNQESVVIIELKQWSEAEKTDKDAVVKTVVGRALRELSHPSYQAWTYAKMIHEYNETVRNDSIQLYPCAYLHNFPRGTFENPILDAWYQEHLNKAPAFLRDDADRLADFIKKHIKHGDHNDILYRIDHGKIKPSKSLGQSIATMLDGNKEFYMIDEQKVVYEELKQLAVQDIEKKRVAIVKGGPGTGKSVIAINILVDLLNDHQLNTQYVTKNAAPRAVYSALLKGYRTKSFIDNLFKNSGSYVGFEADYFDCLIVDEAHRLNEKSGMYGNKGENQIKEIISASKYAIFFIDEAQKVTWKDMGSSEEIKKWSKQFDADVYELELTSQFRCNGSEGYLAWVDHMLDIRETANPTLDTKEFDFQIMESPNELRDKIFGLNTRNNARLLAGYCWDWKKDKKNDTNHHDIQLPEFDFSMSWNLGSDGMEWLIKDTSIHEVGCIHTSQGLELDYIGVIIGDDIRYENNQLICDPTKRAKTDQSLKGFKKEFKANPQEALKKAEDIIKNTYRTLLTRGMKGCYVYFTNADLADHFKKYLR